MVYWQGDFRATTSYYKFGTKYLLIPDPKVAVSPPTFKDNPFNEAELTAARKEALHRQEYKVKNDTKGAVSYINFFCCLRTGWG